MDVRVLDHEVRDYLLLHIHDHPAQFLLRSHPFDIDAKLLVQQLVGLQKSKNKFPKLYDNKKVIYPLKINLEQTSSETTAHYKTSIVTGKTMIDLTGGFGIDVSAFAKAGFSSTHLELSETLQPYAVQLFKALNLEVKSLNTDGMRYLHEELDHVDVIYVDPGRKTTAHSKAIRLEDYEPNILGHLELLLQKCNTLLVKTSPMLDIYAGMKQLEHVSEIHIVAVKNEVKELLWLLNKEIKNPKTVCVNLETDQPDLEFPSNLDQHVIAFSNPRKFLYEPNASIMKSGGFKSMANLYKVEKLSSNTHLFTSDSLVNFPGRVFEIRKVDSYKPKLVNKKFGKSARGVVTRNFKNSVKELRSKYKLTEHDTDYLFFTQVERMGAVVIDCFKL
jgi:hypothetical protein